ncbi:MAG: hypothetical protein VX610_07075 [SAR324 cluster bacterium]|nr:hypothetical protein [SAR324 cluster bacterium]
MIVKAIPKDGGLFIPGFSLPESVSADEVRIHLQVLPCDETVPQEAAKGLSLEDLQKAAGTLPNLPQDAVAYQREIRDEWD